MLNLDPPRQLGVLMKPYATVPGGRGCVETFSIEKKKEEKEKENPTKMINISNHV